MTSGNCSQLSRAVFLSAYNALQGKSVAPKIWLLYSYVSTRQSLIQRKRRNFLSSRVTLTCMNICLLSVDNAMLSPRNCKITLVRLLSRSDPFSKFDFKTLDLLATRRTLPGLFSLVTGWWGKKEAVWSESSVSRSTLVTYLDQTAYQAFLRSLFWAVLFWKFFSQLVKFFLSEPSIVGKFCIFLPEEKNLIVSVNQLCCVVQYFKRSSIMFGHCLFGWRYAYFSIFIQSDAILNICSSILGWLFNWVNCTG